MRTRPRAIPLAMITIRKILHGFPFLSHDDYGAPLGGPSGHRSSAKNTGTVDAWVAVLFKLLIKIKATCTNKKYDLLVIQADGFLCQTHYTITTN